MKGTSNRELKTIRSLTTVIAAKPRRRRGRRSPTRSTDGLMAAAAPAERAAPLAPAAPGPAAPAAPGPTAPGPAATNYRR